jgi:predicted HTH transcriptional regulator
LSLGTCCYNLFASKTVLPYSFAYYKQHQDASRLPDTDRIEIISPGKLPNSLTAEQITKGVRRSRNNIIASLAPDLLEYRGAGSGILRALQAYPEIQFNNDTEGEQFKVIIKRPEIK